jgi:transcriptional regulator of acetoin/glycerol metabolism
MLESNAKIRTSAALLDRLSRTLMLTPEEHALLFELGIPESRLGTGVVLPLAPANESATGEILDGLPTVLASAAAGRPVEIESAAFSLARARQHYHRTGTADGTPTRSRICNSWNRCRKLGVDPDKRAAPRCGDIAERRSANKHLLKAARPILSYLAHQFAGGSYVIVVADSDGIALELGGDVDTRRRLTCAEVGVEAGGDWSEASAGTNAIGTAIADRRPMQAWASEHYCEGATALTSTAALICAPATREIAGVLNLTASYKLVRPHLLGVVMQAALEIEEQLVVTSAPGAVPRRAS